MRSRLLTLVFMLLALILVMPAAAQDAPADNPLLDMLRYVPNTPENRAYITYGDAAAWHESWNVPRIDNLEELEALDEFSQAYWINILPRQAIPLDVTGGPYLFSDDLRGAYGFDLFNVDRYLQAGQPPAQISVIDYAFERTQIDTALTEFGYEAQPLDEATLYSILGDNEVDLQGETITTRTGQLGQLNRIAVMDGRLVVTRSTPVMESAFEAANGAFPSLADDQAYAALAGALYDPALTEGTGDLTSVIILAGTHMLGLGSPMRLLGEQITEEAVATLEAERAALPPLPAYALAGFAVYHTPGKTTLVLAVPFPEGTDAEAVAQGINTRMAGYVSLRMRNPFIESALRAEPAFTTALESNGMPVAIVAFTAADPPREISKDDPLGGIRSFAPSWYDSVVALDLGFLVPSE